MDKPNSERKKPGPKPKPPVQEKDIAGLKYFQLIRDLLEPLHTHADCHNRNLHYDQFAGLILLYLLNPVLTSQRSIQNASGLRNVQKALGGKRASLGSLSEASRVFDPDLLHHVVQELAGRAEAFDAHPRPDALAKELDVLAVDSTLLRALPRMLWALWLGKEHRAAKMHLAFDILRGIPRDATVTDGNGNEKKVMRDWLAADKLYVLDSGYAQYALLEEIRKAGSSFVMRLHDNAAYQVEEERELSEADRQAGVLFDRIVGLGAKAGQKELSHPFRLVKVHLKSPPQRGLARRPSRVSRKKTFRHRPQDYDLLLVTDLMDLPAEEISLLYRYRWTIELFFRWFKCVLRFEHLIFESHNGLCIQVYCALIVSLLITLWTGRKPTKRTLEMIQLYFQGWAELDELEAHFQSLKKIET